MTHTDQAFINAYQTANSSSADAVPLPSGPVASVANTVRQPAFHGPHMPLTGSKTPLSEAIAMRMRHAATGGQQAVGFDARIRMRRFEWPRLIDQLATRHRDQYLNLAPQLAATERIVLGIAGVRQGSGATTTALAMTRCLANERGPVTLIDADPVESGSAANLGFYRCPTLSETLAAGGPIGAATIHAAADRVSLMLAGQASTLLSVTDRTALAQTGAVLRERSPYTLVDLGAALDDHANWGPASTGAALMSALQPAGVLLVRCPTDLSGAVAAAQSTLEAAGVAVWGLVENASATLVQ